MPCLPGTYGEIVVQPFPTTGPFTVVLTLKKPGASPDPLMATQHHQIRGDSNIKFPDDAGETISLPGDFDGWHVNVTAVANEERFLAKLKITGVGADSFSSARERALPPLTYILNCLSFEHDVPIEIHQIDVIDEPTNQQSFTVRIPFAVGFLEALTMNLEMHRHAALYREGLNTPNELYAFLCFFKLVELLDKERRQEDAALIASEQKPRRAPIVAPKDDDELVKWLTRIFPSWYIWTREGVASAIPSMARGAKFGYLAEKYLTPLRNKIAHGLLDQEGAIDIDDPLLRQSVKTWTPYCRTIARMLLLERFYTPSASGMVNSIRANEGTMLCIICMEMKPQRACGGEHVISYALGGSLTIDRVCEDCDNGDATHFRYNKLS